MELIYLIAKFFVVLLFLENVPESRNHVISNEIIGSDLVREVPYTILVEGNVGCGKSTFLTLFDKIQDVQVVQEPVNEWQNVSGTGINMLQMMFDDGPRWSGTFQSLSTLTRLQHSLATSVGKPIRIMERSLYSERICFLENQLAMGKIEQVEYIILDQWFSLIHRELREKIKPDLIIYLRADLDTIRKRIIHRGRPEEQNLEPGFLEGLQERHDSWLLFKNSTFDVPCRVMLLDGNKNFEQIKEDVLLKWNEIFP